MSELNQYFTFKCEQGLKKRGLDNKTEDVDRLKFELDTILSMNFAGYFLIVCDFINWAKKNDISVGPGRGSGAGSLCCYALEITHLDPIKYDLLFERFLNSGRMGKFEERPSYVVEADGQTLEFEEGSLVRIKRSNKETVIFVHELVEGDEIIRY